MAESEKDLAKPASQLHLSDGASLRVSDGTHDLDLRKDGDTLMLQLSRDEHSIFSIAVLNDGRIHQVFDAATASPATSHLLTSEVREDEKQHEYPPITIEGYAGRQGSYRDSTIRKDEKEYYVYLYYRPTPSEDWQYVIPYHVHFFGDLAEQAKEQKIGTEGRKLVRITGELHTRQIIPKQGGERKTQYDVYATGYEFIKGRPSPMPGETRKRG